MSKLLKNIFSLAMESIPHIPCPARDKAEKELRARLDPEGLRLFHAYIDACDDRAWDDMSYLFYTGLALGIELAAFTPNAGACHR